MKILDTKQFIAERVKVKPITNAELDVIRDNIDAQQAKEKNPYEAKYWDVGDIVLTSWGYSMTIVDFYKITKKVGKASFEFEKLESKLVSGSYNSPSGYEVVPDENTVIGTLRGRIGKHGYVKIGGHIATLWNGKPAYENHCD